MRSREYMLHERRRPLALLAAMLCLAACGAPRLAEVRVDATERAERELANRLAGTWVVDTRHMWEQLDDPRTHPDGVMVYGLAATGGIWGLIIADGVACPATNLTLDLSEEQSRCYPLTLRPDMGERFYWGEGSESSANPVVEHEAHFDGRRVCRLINGHCTYYRRASEAEAQALVPAPLADDFAGCGPEWPRPMWMSASAGDGTALAVLERARAVARGDRPPPFAGETEESDRFVITGRGADMQESPAEFFVPETYGCFAESERMHSDGQTPRADAVRDALLGEWRTIDGINPTVRISEDAFCWQRSVSDERLWRCRPWSLQVSHTAAFTIVLDNVGGRIRHGSIRNDGRLCLGSWTNQNCYERANTIAAVTR